MPKLTLDEAVHYDGGGGGEENSSNNQAGVDDLCLCTHPLSLFTIGERGKARTDKGVKQ